MTLSVIIISHNQRDQVKRCIESVLEQELPFEYEIVISDDNSTDGSWELEQDYSARHSFIKVYQCNSDACNPSYVAERAGYNRINAYKHASGKYFCHIDGDDYYRPGSSCLKEMVALLEEHPECSICMQNGWVLKDGADLKDGRAFYEEHLFSNGQILLAKEYLQSGLLVNNGAMMMRRNPKVDLAKLYHKFYDDSVITAHHLQFGSIVTLDCCDWIYIQHQESITSELKKVDAFVIWNLDCSVYLATLIPSLRVWFYSSKENRKILLDTVRLIRNGVSLESETKAFCSQFPDVFIYKLLTKGYLSACDRIRLDVLRRYLKRLLELEQVGTFQLLLLDKLCR